MPVLTKQRRVSHQTAIVYTPMLLDAFSGATFAFSFRKLRGAYSGSAVRIRRSSDNAEQDIGFIGESFDAASASSFIGGGSGSVTTWYDQSGNGYDVTQATAGQQPGYSATAINSRPGISNVRASNQCLFRAAGDVATGSATVASVFVIAAVDLTLGAAGMRLVSATGVGSAGADFSNLQSFAATCAITGQSGVTCNSQNRQGYLPLPSLTPYQLSGILGYGGGPSMQGWVDRVALAQPVVMTAAPTYGGAGGLVYICTFTAITVVGAPDNQNFAGQGGETVVYYSDKTTDRLAIQQNMANFWGTL